MRLRGRFFGGGKERGPQDASAAAEPTPVLNDTSFRIRGARTVEAQVLYGHPKHPTSFSVSFLLNDTTTIEGQDLGNGTVRGHLDSDARKLAVSRKDDSKLAEEDSALAIDLVGRQHDLLSALNANGVGRGSLVRIVLTVPTSSLLV
jgi:hypothetical protein